MTDISMKKHSRYNVAKNSLLFWCLFIGVGAVAGATGMLVDPSGAGKAIIAVATIANLLVQILIEIILDVIVKELKLATQKVKNNVSQKVAYVLRGRRQYDIDSYNDDENSLDSSKAIDNYSDEDK